MEQSRISGAFHSPPLRVQHLGLAAENSWDTVERLRNLSPVCIHLSNFRLKLRKRRTCSLALRWIRVQELSARTCSVSFETLWLCRRLVRAKQIQSRPSTHSPVSEL